jgi:hypothetical protein
MSKVNLALLCAYSFRSDVETHDRPSGLPARIGTGAHGRVEDWFHGNKPRELDEDIADKAERIAAQMIAWLEPKRDRIIHCEIGLRYDADNDRAAIGPKRGEPGYSDVPDMVLPGTLDLAIRGVDEVLEVIDVKTGQKKYVHDEQVDVQGLALARKLNERVVRVGFIFPRLTKCDEPVLRTLDDRALDLQAGEIHSLMRRLPMAEPAPGEWCWRCEARPSCPAFGAAQAEDSERSLQEAGFFA